MDAQQTAGTWDEDPDGASILVATGRPRHDLLVVAEPAMLTGIDEDWGSPVSHVPLSFLPGVGAPTVEGQEDSLDSFDRDGLGVLVARGRTFAYEGVPARATTALVRTVASHVRAALFITRAASLGTVFPGRILPVSDHLNLTGRPLFPAAGLVDGTWDERLVSTLAGLDGIGRPGVVALTPGPLRTTPAEARAIARMGADAVVHDSVVEAMSLAVRGIRVAGLVYIDSRAGRSQPDQADGARRSGIPAASQDRVPEAVRSAVDAVLTALH